MGSAGEWDLLAREVVGAQLSSYWAHRRLEVPEIKWVQTNNYKFHTFRSIHFNPSQSPRPSFQFSEGLVLRLIQGKVSGSMRILENAQVNNTIQYTIFPIETGLAVFHYH